MMICIGNVVNDMLKLIYWREVCSDEVKIDLFRAYCTSFYTAPLWFKFKKESKLQVAYDDCMRILLKKQDGAVQVI